MRLTPSVMRLTVETPEQMAELGRRIARQLRAGDLVALDGELGAGKTTLTRGLGEQLEVRGAVTSPTFVLARTHPRQDGGAPLVHVDAYRLGSTAELDDLDIDFPASIVVVEWAAGMIDGMTDSVLEVAIERPTGARVGSPDGRDRRDHDDREDDDDDVEPRTVTITGRGPRWEAEPFV